MSAFRFDPIDLLPECETLRGEVRQFIDGEIAALRGIIARGLGLR